MKGIYLGAFKAYHPNHNIVYQDINGQRDLDGDMMDVDLADYDYIIATPPCNWWSRANYRRNSSEYALKTKHLLIDILYKLARIHRPFIVENVRNDAQFEKHGLFSYHNIYVYKVGRHTYWSNEKFDVSHIKQEAKSDYKNGKKRWLSSQGLSRNARQGGEEVHEVIELFIQHIEKEYGERRNSHARY